MVIFCGYYQFMNKSVLEIKKKQLTNVHFHKRDIRNLNKKIKKQTFVAIVSVQQ